MWMQLIKGKCGIYYSFE